MREFVLFSLERKNFLEDLQHYPVFKGAYNKDGDKHFSKICSNGFELQEGRFRIRKTFFAVRVVFRKAVDAPFLAAVKARLGRALTNLV